MEKLLVVIVCVFVVDCDFLVFDELIVLLLFDEVVCLFDVFWFLCECGVGMIYVFYCLDEIF